MPTVTVKMPVDLHARLEAEAARRRTTKSAILRESFSRMTEGKSGKLWDRVKHLAGSIDGPGNLSMLSKTLPGYGRRRPR